MTRDVYTQTWGRWYVLAVLTLVYTFNIADRFVVSTLIEPIKADLGLSDSGIASLRIRAPLAEGSWAGGL